MFYYCFSRIFLSWSITAFSQYFIEYQRISGTATICSHFLWMWLDRYSQSKFLRHAEIATTLHAGSPNSKLSLSEMKPFPEELSLHLHLKYLPNDLTAACISSNFLPLIDLYWFGDLWEMLRNFSKSVIILNTSATGALTTIVCEVLFDSCLIILQKKEEIQNPP